MIGNLYTVGFPAESLAGSIAMCMKRYVGLGGMRRPGGQIDNFGGQADEKGNER